jgi:antitoxin component YwqK of YwqJK toxin-antitoxin module/tetratricopeptide (TPR) repeat protein
MKKTNRNLKSLLLTVVWIVLACVSGLGQEHNPLLNSREVLKKAQKLYDDGSYKASAEQCAKVSENDSNYYEALSNRVSAYIAYKQDSLAALYARKGINGKSAYQYTFYNLLGVALIAMDKDEEAINLYKEALVKFPYANLLYYNMAVCQRKLKRSDEAIASLEKSITLSPYHAKSHLKLGLICLEQNKIVPGILALEMFLIIDPDSKSAKDMILLLEKVVKGENELDETKGVAAPASNTDDFSDVEEIIKSKIALSKRYTSLTKLNYDVVKQVQVLLEKLVYNKNDKGFFMQNYVPFYKELFSKDYFEPFVYYSMSSVADEDMAKWRKSKRSKIDAFTKWATDFLNQQRGSGPVVVNGEKKTYSLWYFGDNTLEAIGNENEKKKPIGPWIVYYNNGELLADGAYDNEGNKTGIWNWYYENGILKERSEFKKGQRDGTTELYTQYGVLASKTPYQSDKVAGDYTSFYVSGDPEIKLHFVNGNKEGSANYFYQNGAKQYEMNYKNNELDGAFKGYFPTGETEFTCTYVNGKKTGDYVSYFRNGKIESKGLDKDNDPTGKWSYYFSNGTLEKEGEYSSKGEAKGTWKFYYENGKLSEEKTFDDGGKLTGKIESHDQYGRLSYAHEYKNGSFLSYQDFDKSGKVIAEGKSKDKKMFVKYKYTNGNPESEGQLENGKKTGEWNFFMRNGKRIKTENDIEDVADGKLTTYFTNDSTEFTINFTKGEKDGYYKAWYKNGKLYCEGWYKGDKQVGDWYFYNEKGNLVTHNYFDGGVTSGWQYHFNPNGKPLTSTYYQADVLQKSLFFDSTGTQSYAIELKNGAGDFISHYPNGKSRVVKKIRNGFVTGKYQLFFPSGKVELEGDYVLDKEVGVWTCYYEDGKVRYTETYENGKLSGPLKKYYRNGNLSYDGTFREGKLDGKLQTFYENKQLEQESWWQLGNSEGTNTSYSEDGGGQLEYSRKYEEDELLSYTYKDKTGNLLPDIAVQNETVKLVTYYPNGNKSLEKEIKYGILDGIYTEYFTTGKIRQTAKYVAGNKEGVQKIFYPNGQPKSVENYFYDKRDGLCTFYYDDGKPERIENYSLDDRNGKCVYYDKTGKVIKTQIYYYGILYSEK